MKTKGLYALAIDRRGNLFYSKMFVVSLIIAIIVAAFPGVSVLAANNQNTVTNAGLEDEWRNKLHHLRYQGLYYDNIRLYPAGFDDLSDLARAQFENGTGNGCASAIPAARPTCRTRGTCDQAHPQLQYHHSRITGLDCRDLR